MRAYGQKLVKFCTHTHAAKLVVEMSDCRAFSCWMYVSMAPYDSKLSCDDEESLTPTLCVWLAVNSRQWMFSQLHTFPVHWSTLPCTFSGQTDRHQALTAESWDYGTSDARNAREIRVCNNCSSLPSSIRHKSINYLFSFNFRENIIIFKLFNCSWSSPSVLKN